MQPPEMAFIDCQHCSAIDSASPQGPALTQQQGGLERRQLSSAVCAHTHPKSHMGLTGVSPPETRGEAHGGRSGDLSHVCKYPGVKVTEPGYVMASSERIRGKGGKWKYRNFHWKIRKCIFTVREVKGGVEPLSLEMLRTPMDTALSSLLQLTQRATQGWGRMISRGTSATPRGFIYIPLTFFLRRNEHTRENSCCSSEGGEAALSARKSIRMKKCS